MSDNAKLMGGAAMDDPVKQILKARIAKVRALVAETNVLLNAISNEGINVEIDIGSRQLVCSRYPARWINCKFTETHEL